MSGTATRTASSAACEARLQGFPAPADSQRDGDDFRGGLPLYKLEVTVVSAATWDLMAKLLAVAPGFAISGVLQVMYGFFVLHEFVIRYNGIIDVLWNWGVVTGA